MMYNMYEYMVSCLRYYINVDGKNESLNILKSRSLEHSTRTRRRKTTAKKRGRHFSKNKKQHTSTRTPLLGTWYTDCVRVRVH